MNEVDAQGAVDEEWLRLLSGQGSCSWIPDVPNAHGACQALQAVNGGQGMVGDLCGLQPVVQARLNRQKQL